jgi:metal-sulfur cluster biosynthetic enzyme
MESFAVREALRAVLDPEVGINIVDLGLVYRAEESEGWIRVEMTMTSPACPVGNLLRAEAEDALRGRFPEAQEVRVELVWSPPWHPGMMSPAGRQQLGLET